MTSSSNTSNLEQAGSSLIAKGGYFEATVRRLVDGVEMCSLRAWVSWDLYSTSAFGGGIKVSWRRRWLGLNRRNIRKLMSGLRSDRFELQIQCKNSVYRRLQWNSHSGGSTISNMLFISFYTFYLSYFNPLLSNLLHIPFIPHPHHPHRQTH